MSAFDCQGSMCISIAFFLWDINNNADPDEKPHNAVSDQDLHCLLTECSNFILKNENYHPTPLELEMEPRHEISNNLVCATSKASDQPAHARSLIRAFASRLSIL